MAYVVENLPVETRGRWLAGLRRGRMLSQEQLAAEVGISRNTIATAEAGKSVWSPKIASKVLYTLSRRAPLSEDDASRYATEHGVSREAIDAISRRAEVEIATPTPGPADNMTVARLAQAIALAVGPDAAAQALRGILAIATSPIRAAEARLDAPPAGPRRYVSAPIETDGMSVTEHAPVRPFGTQANPRTKLNQNIKYKK